MEDEQLGSRLYDYFIDHLRLIKLIHEAKADEWPDLMEKLLNDAQVLVDELRKNLLSSDTGNTNYLSASVMCPIVAGIAVLAAVAAWLN